MALYNNMQASIMGASRSPTRRPPHRTPNQNSPIPPGRTPLNPPGNNNGATGPVSGGNGGTGTAPSNPSQPGATPSNPSGGTGGSVNAPNPTLAFNPIAPGGIQGGAFSNFADNLPDMFSRFGGQQLGDIYNQATGGTINAYNTAANRLRERLDSSTRGQQQAEASRNLGRGFGNSGYNDMRRNQIASQGQYNYGQGLDTLSNQFETQRQQGLQTALGAQNSDIGNRNQMDQMLYNLFNNRENRQAQTNIANAGNASQAGMNNQNNALQELLAQLQQLNNNSRSA